MPLYQNSVLKTYLAQQDKELVAKAYKKFTKYFHNPERQQNIREIKEEGFQQKFLIELFVTVFGYVINPDPKYNLSTEFKNEKGAKKADGAILRDGIALGVIELKSTKLKDLEKIRQQAFDYKANQTGCVYVITSNFEKLRFYINNAVEFEEFDLFTLSEERFQLLYLCLEQSNILNNVPLAIKQASIQQEKKITDNFYKDYSLFKRELFRDLVKQNMKNEVFRTELDNADAENGVKNIKRSLFKKSQKLIDRFLFIFFAEDSTLLTSNSSKKILDKWKADNDFGDERPLYDLFKQYFRFLDSGRKGTESRAEIFAYNGGLFKPDAVLDSLIIDNDLLNKHIDILQAYDFDSQVDVNILGHIFENSLNEIESVNAEIDGVVFDKQKTKRKKDGVFYTPKYITKYIVDNTVGKLCSEKKITLKILEDEYRPRRQNETKKRLLSSIETYREWLLQLTILDPACGSGAFLNQALDFLIKEHQYIDELQTKLLGGGFVFPNIENTVLENNIYGVDLNEESVEIAKLSLWLRTAQPRRKLNSLSSNIKCGNSLIDSKAIAGDKAFKWEEEFTDVFTKGGFDVVIGNPPYVDVKGLDNEIVKYLFQTFKSANNRVNLYSSFIEKSVDLISKEGCLSFIIPSSLLTQDSYKELRELLLDNTTIENIVRLPNESFGGGAGDVKVDTIILTFKSGIHINSDAEIIIYKGFDRINEIAQYNSDLHFSVNPFDWKKDENFLFRINVDNSTIAIVNKCQVDTRKLIECAEFCLGLTPYDKYKGHSQEQIKNRVFHSSERTNDSFRKLLAGNDIKRYGVEWGNKEWISYGDWLGAPREQRFFTAKRILVKQIIDWSDKRIWAALTEDELYNTQNAFNLIPKDEYQAEYLIALINSRLMSFYHKKQFLEEFKDRFQKILIKDAKEFPIKIISTKQQQIFVDKVHRVIAQTAQSNNITNAFSRYVSSQLSLDKLSRKLQNWHELEFGGFIKELNKAIKKVGGEKLTKIDEMEWIDVFETKKAEAQTLKTQIDTIDKEIDVMVYELYSLSDEEIKIVEGC